METHITAKDIRNVYNLREMIELYAVSQFGRNFPIHDLLKFLKLFQKPLDESSKEELYEADIAFHEELVRATDNEYLIESYALLKAQMASQFRLSGSPERLEESNKEHIRIINAMLGEDLEEAEAALRDHLRKARESGYDIVVTPDMGDDTGSDN